LLPQSGAGDCSYSVTGLAAGSYRVQFGDPIEVHPSVCYASAGFVFDATDATHKAGLSPAVAAFGRQQDCLPGPQEVVRGSFRGRWRGPSWSASMRS
jgi:hypothetical protein